MVIKVGLGHRLSNLRLVGVAVTEVKTRDRGKAEMAGQVWRP